MKIKTEDYTILRDFYSTALQSFPHTIAEYVKAGMSEKRYRWDVLHAARVDEGGNGIAWVCKNLYQYMNDENIDTALRRVIKEMMV